MRKSKYVKNIHRDGQDLQSAAAAQGRRTSATFGCLGPKGRFSSKKNKKLCCYAIKSKNHILCRNGIMDIVNFQKLRVGTSG